MLGLYGETKIKPHSYGYPYINLQSGYYTQDVIRSFPYIGKNVKLDYNSGSGATRVGKLYYFNGTTSYNTLTTPYSSLSFTQDWTLIAYLRVKQEVASVSTYRHLFTTSNYDGQFSFGICTEHQRTTSLGIFVGKAGYTIQNLAAIPLPTVYKNYIVRARFYANTGFNTTINGVNYGNTNYDAGTLSSAVATSDFCMGADMYNGGMWHYTIGYIGDIVFTNKIISDSECLQIEHAMKKKFSM